MANVIILGGGFGGVVAAERLAELLGGVTAVAALQQVLLDIREEGAATANRNVQEAVVEAAILGRREFPMGMYTPFSEFFMRLFESGRRGVEVHTQKSSRDRQRLRLDLHMPQQTAEEAGKGME